MEGKSYSAPTKKDLEQENGESENSEDGTQPMENASTKDLIEEVSDLHLERCMRIVPHDQNSGAFFSIAAALAPKTKTKTKTKEIRFLLTTCAWFHLNVAFC